MATARLRDLPPSVVDEFVSMQLKKSYRSDELSPKTPSNPYKVEYRLVRKKKPSQRRGYSPSESPSSLRYSSPIPLESQRQVLNRQIILKPIESSEQTIVAERKHTVKTPELVKLSVQRIESFESMAIPRSTETEVSTLQRPLPPIESHRHNLPSGRTPVLSHRFVCPQCKCDIYKELFVTFSEDDELTIAIPQSRSSERPISVTFGTQTDSEPAGSTEKSNSQQPPAHPGDEDDEEHATLDTSTLSNYFDLNQEERSTTVIVEEPATRSNNSNDEDANIEDPVTHMSSEDSTLIEECRQIARSAEKDGSAEAIRSAIAQFAVIAQKQLTTRGGAALQHGRVICGKIGDILVEEGFYPRLYQVLHGMVSGWEFFARDETYRVTFNLFTALTSFTNLSSHLQANLLENTNMIPQILSILGYKKYLNLLTQKNMWRFFDANLTILCHMARTTSLCSDLRASGVVATSKRFLPTGELGYVGLWLPSTVIMARIATDAEIATSVKGNVTDFIVTITRYIVSYFASSKSVEDDASVLNEQLDNSTTMMPRGTSIMLAELTSAFFHFLLVILEQNRKPDKEFYVAQPELDELVRCSLFLMELPRPQLQQQKHDPYSELTLDDWRHLLNCGLKIASICQELAILLQLGFPEKDVIQRAVSRVSKMEFKEEAIKTSAEALLKKLQNQPNDVSPPARTVTEIIAEPASKSPYDSTEITPRTPTTVLSEKPSTPANHEASSLTPSNEALWTSLLVTWQNAQVRSWMKSIGLEKFADEFSDYDGHMLLALFDVRRESPQYFQKEVSAKLGDVFNNFVRFTAELAKLVANNHLVTTPPGGQASIDQ